MASSLKSFVPTFDTINYGGTETDIYFAPVDEIANNPKSAFEMTPSVTSAGARNTVGEAYTFVTTPTGTGYFRKMSIIPDTGDIAMNGSMKDQTVKAENTFKFKIKGFGAVEKEFAELLIAAAGFVFLIPDKTGVLHEIGRKTRPATFSKFAGGTGGDFRGIDFELMYNGGMVRTYPSNLAIDETPNA